MNSLNRDRENKKHLWDVKHAYYCNLGNYFNNDCGDKFESFEDFLEEYRDSDFDMNLVFRWDWLPNKTSDEGLPKWSSDDYYRDGTLYIFWMGQRKGLYRWSEVSVCRKDEEQVIKFLRPRLKHLMKLWNPL